MKAVHGHLAAICSLSSHWYVCHVSESLPLSQSLSECEDSNYPEYAEHVSDAYKGTVTFINDMKRLQCADL